MSALSSIVEEEVRLRTQIRKLTVQLARLRKARSVLRGAESTLTGKASRKPTRKTKKRAKAAGPSKRELAIGALQTLGHRSEGYSIPEIASQIHQAGGPQLNGRDREALRSVVKNGTTGRKPVFRVLGSARYGLVT